MQVILGAGGSIGNELAKVLPEYTDKIRLVSRTPKKVNPGDEILSADLTKPKECVEAVKGADVAYLTVGLPYKLKVWKALWPKIMENVLTACEKHSTRLVFFDNVYMYGKVDGWMTEECPHEPDSKKGEIRAEVAEMFLNAIATDKIEGIIARSADFHGKSPVAIPGILVYENFAKGKAAQCLSSDKTVHSYTYIPDAAKATALLGNTEEAYGQIWHLPTDKNVLDGKTYIEMVANAMHAKPRYFVMKKWMLRLMGLFNAELAEIPEMMYQNAYDYKFDSSKFTQHFDLKPTPYAVAIRDTAEAYLEEA